MPAPGLPARSVALLRHSPEERPSEYPAAVTKTQVPHIAAHFAIGTGAGQSSSHCAPPEFLHD